MKLRNERLLGQGAIDALTAIGPANPLLVAAIGARLHTYDGTKLTHRAQSAVRHAGQITCLAADPKPTKPKATQHLFASGGRDGRLIVWGVTRESVPVAAAEHQLDAPVIDLSWQPVPSEEACLAAALEDGRIGLWWPDDDRLETFAASDEPVRTVGWFPDGEHLASGGDDGVIRIWRLPERSQAELLRHYNAISQVRVSACGRYVAYVSEDEKGALFDLSRRESSAFGEPADPVVALAWHPKDPRLLAGTQSGGYLVYAADEARLEPTRVIAHIHPCEAVAWSPDTIRAYTGGRDGGLLAIEQRDAGWTAFRVHIAQPQGYALNVAWLDRHKLSASYSSGQVVVFHREDGKPRKVFEKAHTRPAYGLAVSPNGKAVASGGVDRRIKVWDVAEGLQAHDLGEVHKKPIYGVCFSPDGRYLATGSGDTYLVVYDIQAMKKAAKEAFGKDEYWHFAVRNRILNCVAWSPKGHTIAVGLSNHQVVLLPVTKDGRVSKGPTLNAHDDAVSAVAFSRDGARLVSVGYDRRIAIWDVTQDAPRLVRERVVEHADPIQALALHPAGEIIATGSWDASIRLWSAADLSARGVQTGPHFSAVEGLAFDGSGTRLASASSDGTVGVWRVIP